MFKKRCDKCSSETIPNIKLEKIEEGDSVVYIEYFICSNCKNKNIISIYRTTEQFY